MPDNHDITRYRHWYRRLLRLYSRPYRERFAESMEQTFNDLCRERAEAGRGVVGFVLWAFVDTSAGIIRENARSVMTQNKNIIRIAIVTALILLVPFVARAPWTLSDYIAAGVLLFGTGLTYELVSRKGSRVQYRAAVGIACATGLLLVWMNLAVGLIGSEDNLANVLYIGVFAIGFLGAIVARLQPRGMARTLFATAAAQALVPVIAFSIWRPPINSGLVGVLGINAFFIVLWVASALLFRQAAECHGTGTPTPSP